MKHLLLHVLLFLGASVFSQVKHALLIGVGDYPDRPSDQKSWSDLSSANDISLVKGMLLGQNYSCR
jgi:hypothetical protein